MRMRIRRSWTMNRARRKGTTISRKGDADYEKEQEEESEEGEEQEQQQERQWELLSNQQEEEQEQLEDEKEEGYAWSSSAGSYMKVSWGRSWKRSSRKSRDTPPSW